MPTYEYACANCNHQWEEVQRITEAPLERCPRCSRASAHRLISGGTNFILKGGGWYSDLYASPKPSGKKEEPAASPSTGETAKAANGGTPEKPASAQGGTSSASPAATPKATSDAA